MDTNRRVDAAKVSAILAGMNKEQLSKAWARVAETPHWRALFGSKKRAAANMRSTEYRPNGGREVERRRRQIADGSLTRANGLV